MKSIRLKICASAIVATLGQGCATEPAPMLENSLSEAVRTARVQQTIDLNASKNTDPVSGIDGVSAKITIDQYHRSFEAPPPTFTILNVGGAPVR
jgi:PBP1b-binding outer membrane lipoprotein LpoB